MTCKPIKDFSATIKPWTYRDSGGSIVEWSDDWSLQATEQNVHRLFQPSGFLFCAGTACMLLWVCYTTHYSVCHGYVWGCRQVTLTLQLDLIFWALHKNRANGIKVVIVTASERTGSCLCHLGNRNNTIPLHFSSSEYIYICGKVLIFRSTKLKEKNVNNNAGTLLRFFWFARSCSEFALALTFQSSLIHCQSQTPALYKCLNTRKRLIWAEHGRKKRKTALNHGHASLFLSRRTPNTPALTFFTKQLKLMMLSHLNYNKRSKLQQIFNCVWGFFWEQGCSTKWWKAIFLSLWLRDNAFLSAICPGQACQRTVGVT